MEEENTKKDVVITYDTLFEILRNEKLREELQQLPENFFSIVCSYLKEKKEFIQKSKSGLFTDDEADKANKQLQNIIKIIKELYNKRERKIVNMVINKSITGSNLIDTSQLLKEESQLFNELLKIMSYFRTNIVDKVITAECPSIGNATTTENKVENKLDSETSRDNTENQTTQAEASKEYNSDERAAENADSNENPDKKAKELKNTDNFESNTKQEMVKIIILEDIPKFIGPNLEIYGPYQKDSETIINDKIAEILVESNKARVLPQDQPQPEKGELEE